MNTKTFLGMTACLLTWVCVGGTGCTATQDDDEDVAEVQSAIVLANAAALNGTVANSSFLNGIRQNGIRQNGIRQNGIRQNSNGLEGTDEETGITISGAGYTGATMEAVLGDASELSVTIASVSDSDVPGMFTYVIEANGTNVCGASGAKAVLLPGSWDYLTATHVADEDHFTVACRGAAIAKCAEWGYRQWDHWTEDNGTNTQEVSFRAFHQACVRMVRADYCGDGVPHTETGTVIDVWDAAGLQEETPGNTLPLEAEWTPSGAACVKHVRWTATAAAPSVDVETYIKTHCEDAWAGPDAQAANAACGSGSSDFFTENGFSAALATRPLLRNASDQHTH